MAVIFNFCPSILFYLIDKRIRTKLQKISNCVVGARTLFSAVSIQDSVITQKLSPNFVFQRQSVAGTF
jgi:hypothetical protein